MYFAVEVSWLKCELKVFCRLFCVEEQNRERQFYSERGLTCDPKGEFDFCVIGMSSFLSIIC